MREKINGKKHFNHKNDYNLENFQKKKLNRFCTINKNFYYDRTLENRSQSSLEKKS